MISRGEAKCREVLERIFEREFPTSRPTFLKNPLTKQNLEIDCYNHELRIACEYQGQQHYVYPNNFHRTQKDFIDGVRRDRFKRKVLERNQIYFIEVPYDVPLDQIEGFIIEKLQKYFDWIKDSDLDID